MEGFKEPLPNEKQLELLKVAKENKEAKDTLILHNLRLVYHFAKKYNNERTEIDDLFQLGVIGLMRAIDKFQFGMNAKFSTYASFWIKQSISRHMFLFTLDKSLDEPLKGAEDMCLRDTIEDEGSSFQEDIEDKIFNEQLGSQIKEILTPKEFKLITLYHGIGGKQHTLKELGVIYECDAEVIRNRLEKICRKIRNNMVMRKIYNEIHERTKFYRSLDYIQPKSKNKSISSPVESLVIEREHIRQRLMKEMGIV